MLRIIGIVPPSSKLWSKIYNKRRSIERWSSNAKRSRLLDKHQLLRMGKIGLHANISMQAWLLTALARLKADDYRHMGSMTIKLPGRPTPAVELREAQGCPDCCAARATAESEPDLVKTAIRRQYSCTATIHGT